jgi:hypothetical protein
MQRMPRVNKSIAGATVNVIFKCPDGPLEKLTGLVTNFFFLYWVYN